MINFLMGILMFFCTHPPCWWDCRGVYLYLQPTFTCVVSWRTGSRQGTASWTHRPLLYACLSLAGGYVNKSTESEQNGTDVTLWHPCPFSFSCNLTAVKLLTDPDLHYIRKSDAPAYSVALCSREKARRPLSIHTLPCARQWVEIGLFTDSLIAYVRAKYK